MSSKLGKWFTGAVALLLVFSALLAIPIALILNWLGFPNAAAAVEIVMVVSIALACIFKKRIFE